MGASGTVAGVTGEDAEEDESPILFVATTVKVYSVPLVNPVNVSGDSEPDAVTPPGDDVTVYEVIAEPPVAGAVQLTVACSFPRVAETDVGASGVVAGVTGSDGEEGAELPTPFLANTVKVYAVPLVNPVTVSGDSDPDAVNPPGDEVTV